MALLTDDISINTVVGPGTKFSGDMNIAGLVRVDGDNPALVVDNADWLKPISYIDFFSVSAHLSECFSVCRYFE